MQIEMPHPDVLPVEPAQRQPPAAAELELTILMPCLNEARTIATCIGKAQRFLAASGVRGEVLIADNGSDDGSPAIARGLGARVVDVPRRGYGAALIAGIGAARGRYVVMGDADDSYDFSALDAYVKALRQGHQLVMGNRFAGGIQPGAMPALHRWLGNPVLSFIGRWFFKVKVRDFHCGLRGFDRRAIQALALRCEGMEFASEMVVKAALARLSIAEVPTTLAPDGRDRPPHLRTWRDGWRHLRFLLLFCPRWLLLYPGIVVAVCGLLQLIYAATHDPAATRWPVGIHTQLYAALALTLGWQTVLFALGTVLARHEARIDTVHPVERNALASTRGLALPLAGAAAALVGLVLCAGVALRWSFGGFGALDPEVAMRQIIPGAALLLTGTQSLLAGVFFAALRGAFASAGRRDAAPPP